jgi:hypothetical protein
MDEEVFKREKTSFTPLASPFHTIFLFFKHGHDEIPFFVLLIIRFPCLGRRKKRKALASPWNY